MEVNFQIIKGIEWIKFAKERGGLCRGTGGGDSNILYWCYECI